MKSLSIVQAASVADRPYPWVVEEEVEESAIPGVGAWLALVLCRDSTVQMR